MANWLISWVTQDSEASVTFEPQPTLHEWQTAAAKKCYERTCAPQSSYSKDRNYLLTRNTNQHFKQMPTIEEKSTNQI